MKVTVVLVKDSSSDDRRMDNIVTEVLFGHLTDEQVLSHMMRTSPNDASHIREWYDAGDVQVRHEVVSEIAT